MATEFVGGSITSEGIVDGRGGGAAPVLTLPADAVVRASNPHIKFSNQQFKRYGVLEAKPDELLVQYKSPQTTQAGTSSMFTLARFRVERGTPQVKYSPDGLVQPVP